MAAHMARPRARIALLVAAALGVALLLAGAPAARGGEAPAVRARDGRIAVEMRDFRFVPQRIRARPGDLTFELHNRGRLGHTFRVRGEGRTWLEVKTLRPGERRTVTRRFEKGDYRIFDVLSNYEELGMYGTLVVR